MFMCEIDASDIENVNSQDNWKVDRNDTTLIRQIMTRRCTTAEARLIKSGVRGISIQQGWQQIQAHGNEESRGVRDELEDADAGALMLMLMRMRLFLLPMVFLLVIGMRLFGDLIAELRIHYPIVHA